MAIVRWLFEKLFQLLYGRVRPNGVYFKPFEKTVELDVRLGHSQY